MSKYHGEKQKCFALESVCADAVPFVFPAEPTVLYLFNPLPESGLRHVIENLKRGLQTHPRQVYVLYHNPLLEHALNESAALKKIGGTHQYAMYSNT